MDPTAKRTAKKYVATYNKGSDHEQTPIYSRTRPGTRRILGYLWAKWIAERWRVWSMPHDFLAPCLLTTTLSRELVVRDTRRTWRACRNHFAVCRILLIGSRGKCRWNEKSQVSRRRVSSWRHIVSTRVDGEGRRLGKIVGL